jgi:uncharacterized protein involved in exopolysaccharide biosynthesis
MPACPSGWLLGLGKRGGHVGISSTIRLASSASEQLQKAISACESSADAVDRGISILATSEDDEGPIASSRSAATAWRDELQTIARELGQLTGELDRLVADLEAVQRRLSPAAARVQEG